MEPSSRPRDYFSDRTAFVQVARVPCLIWCAVVFVWKRRLDPETAFVIRTAFVQVPRVPCYCGVVVFVWDRRFDPESACAMVQLFQVFSRSIGGCCCFHVEPSVRPETAFLLSYSIHSGCSRSRAWRCLFSCGAVITARECSCYRTASIQVSYILTCRSFFLSIERPGGDLYAALRLFLFRVHSR